ncbi:hypothetical protein Q8F55_001028 [Vanrija albida]|uniref:ABC1 atypical kinase-like domain-containing protein n=1 Tax=Vanrija albida TaxID=181172 RepID=A0ABR3QEW5_9TREE
MAIALSQRGLRLAACNAWRSAPLAALSRPTTAQLVLRQLGRERVAPAGTLAWARSLSHSARWATPVPADPSSAGQSPPPPPGNGTASKPKRPAGRGLRRLGYLAVGLAVGYLLYEFNTTFRYSVIALVRYSRLMKAVVLDVWDYKKTFANEERVGAAGDISDEDRGRLREERKACHSRSAKRIYEALKKNSGIYVKLGQHLGAVHVLPKEWTQAMVPLQDQCHPTPVEDVDAMLRKDLGMGIDDLFIDFEPNPIGVASLAQVHRAVDRRSGRPVAVKVQHAALEEFAAVDLAAVNVAIRFVKHVFPDFEFDWLADEMNEMQPLEMNFRHEAANSLRCRHDFQHLNGKTSMYLPEVLWAEQRCLVMEYIDGSRVDDLAYLKKHKIDRNQVSQELARIFSQMVYINGFFHADPHHGNLLIRPKAKNSSSPFNFDLCLLDHGQYVAIPSDLRVNYAHFWLSLMRPATEETIRQRKKYAKLVGNIEEDMYPYLESAITGKISMDSDEGIGGPNSLLDEQQSSSSNDHKKLQKAIMDREGVVADIFELLRTVPRRLLMILKLSDLQRSLDNSLATTHGPHRIYLILGQYCAQAIWQSDREDLSEDYHKHGLSLHLFTGFARSWLSYAYYTTMFGTIEWGMDIRARLTKVGLWFRGLAKGGLAAASQEMAGLTVTA